jgi:glycosyltransferase involved in cell wall biosynthesis
VGNKQSSDPSVVEMHRSPYFDYNTVRNRPPVRWQNPLRAAEKWLGWEDFQHPFTRYAPYLSGLPEPQAFLAHNLHGGFFDLRELPELSRRHTFVWYLHDRWPLTGHCAQPFSCGRWATGCGQCPDLSIPPAIRRDATAFNWKRKRGIYKHSHLKIVASCEWLARDVQRSILGKYQQVHRIRYAPDESVFFPEPRKGQALREELGIRTEERVLVFAAHNASTNPFKDLSTLEAALPLLDPGKNSLRILAVGERGKPWSRDLGRNRIYQSVPYVTERTRMADFYRMADLFVLSTLQEVFPLVILEAKACGCPVVATSVCGVPEMITDGVDGLLVPPSDARALAEALNRLLQDPLLRGFISAGALASTQRFGGIRRMAGEFDRLLRPHRTQTAPPGTCQESPA